MIRQSSEESDLSRRQHTLSKWLQRFQWSDLKYAYGEQHKVFFFVFPTHSAHDKYKLLEVNMVNPMSKTDAECKGPHSKDSPTDKAGSIQCTLCVEVQK